MTSDPRDELRAAIRDREQAREALQQARLALARADNMILSTYSDQAEINDIEREIEAHDKAEIRRHASSIAAGGGMAVAVLEIGPDDPWAKRVRADSLRQKISVTTAARAELASDLVAAEDHFKRREDLVKYAAVLVISGHLSRLGRALEGARSKYVQLAVIANRLAGLWVFIEGAQRQLTADATTKNELDFAWTAMASTSNFERTSPPLAPVRESTQVFAALLEDADAPLPGAELIRI